MENNPITVISQISSKAAGFHESMMKLIQEHSEWHAKSRNESESNFHESLLRALNLSEWISHYVPVDEEPKIETGMQHLIFELRNIINVCDELADQYISEKNRGETAIISQFKEVAQNYYLVLNKVKIV